MDESQRKSAIPRFAHTHQPTDVRFPINTSPTRVVIKTCTFFGITLFLSTLLIAMFFVSWTASQQWHTDIEIIATLLAFVIGILALVHYYSDRTNIFLFIGTGFLGAAFLDCYHVVVTSVSFSLRFSSEVVALDVWSWVASRLFVSLFLCFSAIASLTTFKKGKFREQPVAANYVYFMAALLASLTFLFFAFMPLPISYYPTFLFPSPMEFIPAILFLIALFFYLTRGRWKYDGFEFWLILFLILNVILQACYMSLSGNISDTMFNMAHVLKVISYVLILVGLLVSMHERFKFAVQSVKQLEIYSNQLKQQAEIHKKMADFDALTELGTRNLFNRDLIKALKKTKRTQETVALLFLDLDKFKNVNDTFGHAMGDQLLKQVAIRLKNNVRETDEVYRLGGDEFVIILEGNIHTHRLAEISKNIINDLSRDFALGNRQVNISASIGIATTARCGIDPVILTKAADVAMYAAKRRKDVKYQFFTPKL